MRTGIAAVQTGDSLVVRPVFHVDVNMRCHLVVVHVAIINGDVCVVVKSASMAIVYAVLIVVVIVTGTAATKCRLGNAGGVW